MTKEQDKKFQSTKCKECGAEIDISTSGSVRRLVAQARTLKEELVECGKKSMDIRATKNGEIQKLHVTISNILKDLPEKWKKKVYNHVIDMRKEI